MTSASSSPPADTPAVTVTVTVTRRGKADYLARVDLDGQPGRVGCRATSLVASYIGAAQIAAELLRAHRVAPPESTA